MVLPRRCSAKAGGIRAVAISAAVLVLSLGCGARKSAVPSSECGRIISFAPSITETLFALGLGDHVVGVTRFCTYPAQTASLPKVGGYLDPNFEMIISLRPDLVYTLKEHSSLFEFLDKNGIAHAAIDNENLQGILASFRMIGARCGQPVRAESLVAAVELAMAEAPRPSSPPRVLFCVGRDSPGGGAIAKIYAAGPRTFYSQLINKAGGVNAYADSATAYPSISTEGIARLAPDIIVDAAGSMGAIPSDRVREDWEALSMVPAVRTGMVFVLSGDYVTIPGPRIALVLRDLNAIMRHYLTAANEAGK